MGKKGPKLKRLGKNPEACRYLSRALSERRDIIKAGLDKEKAFRALSKVLKDKLSIDEWVGSYMADRSRNTMRAALRKRRLVAEQPIRRIDFSRELAEDLASSARAEGMTLGAFMTEALKLWKAWKNQEGLPEREHLKNLAQRRSQVEN